MIQDLHAHTYYSFCSNDKPEKVVETAIASGIQMLGICDHSYGVGCARKDLCYDRGNDLKGDYGLTFQRYYDHISLIREKYRNRIKILCGIEVSTLLGNDAYAMPFNTDVSMFDFALVENLADVQRSTARGDIFTLAKQFKCPTGIAHTDMFKFIERLGQDPLSYFKKMAENGIFWEINVNYDSLHDFKTHDYVTEFFKNKWQQEIIKKSGVRLSVGFDGHNIREYKAPRVINACNIIKNMGIKLAFENRIL